MKFRWERFQKIDVCEHVDSEMDMRRHDKRLKPKDGDLPLGSFDVAVKIIEQGDLEDRWVPLAAKSRW